MKGKPQRQEVLPDQVRNTRLVYRRWERLVERLPFLRLREFGSASGYPLLLVESVERRDGAPSLYLSAGIHGDEPAPVEGLLRWAEKSLHLMKGWNLQIFPCLNPWGLERNIRCDERGRDLNRCFNLRGVSQITAQLRAMKGWDYNLALMLHEDYDARGFYLYEIACRRSFWGASLRDGLTERMPFDPRRVIEGRKANKGVIRGRIDADLLAELKGHPEAIHLYLNHGTRTFTFETPSEDLLVRRVDLHRHFICLALQRHSSQTLHLCLPFPSKN